MSSPTQRRQRERDTEKERERRKTKRKRDKKTKSIMAESTSPEAPQDAGVGLDDADIWGEDDFGIDVDSLTTAEIRQRRIMIENEIKIIQSEERRITHETRVQKEKIKENLEKIKLNKVLPYLVSNVVEILDSSCGRNKPPPTLRRRKRVRRRRRMRTLARLPSQSL